MDHTGPINAFLCTCVQCLCGSKNHFWLNDIERTSTFRMLRRSFCHSAPPAQLYMESCSAHWQNESSQFLPQSALVVTRDLRLGACCSGRLGVSPSPAGGLLRVFPGAVLCRRRGTPRCWRNPQAGRCCGTTRFPGPGTCDQQDGLPHPCRRCGPQLPRGDDRLPQGWRVNPRCLQQQPATCDLPLPALVPHCHKADVATPSTCAFASKRLHP